MSTEDLQETLELIELAAEVALMDISANAEQMAKTIMKLAQQALEELGE